MKYRLDFPLPPTDHDNDPGVNNDVTITASYRHWAAISAMAQGLSRLNISPECTKSAKALEAALDRILGIGNEL